MAESGASAAPRSYTLRLPGSSWSAARSEGGRWYFYVPRAGAPPTWSPPDGLDYTNAELDAAWLRENPSVSAMPLISSADALKDDQRRLDARHWMKSLCPSLTTLTPLHKPVETALLGYGSPTHPTNIPNYGSTLAVRRTLSAAYAMTAPRALADDASARVSWERLTTEARRTNALTNPTFKQMAAAAPDALRTDASAQLVLAELLVGTYVPMGLTVNLLATLLDAYRPPAPVGASASTSSSDAAPLAARGTGGGAAEDGASASAGGSSSPSASASDGARALGGQEAAMQVMVQMFREKYRAEVGASLLASAREQEGSEWLARVIPDVLTVAEWRSVMISLSDASPDDRFLTSIVQAMESGMYWDDALKARVMAGSLTSLRHVLMQAIAARGLLTPAPLKSLPQPAALYWRSLGADAEALSHAAHHGLISNVVLERLIKDTVSAAREGELPPPYLLRSLRMATLRQAIGMKLVQGGASSAVACSVVPLERALVDVYAAEPSHDEALPFVSITQHLATLRRVASKHAAALWRDFAPGEQFVQTLLEQAALRTAPPLPYSAALPEEGGTALAAARRAHALCVAPLPALDVQEFMGALLSCVECMLERNAWAAVIAEKEKLGNGGAPSGAADADAAGEDGEAAAAAQQAQRAYIDQLLAAASAVASTASQPDVLAFLSYLLFNPEVSIDARLAPPDAFVQLGLKVPRLAAPLDCLAFTFSWLCWAAAAGGHPMGPPPHGVSNLSSHAMPGHALFVPPADVACAWVPVSPDGETTDVDAAWMTTLKAAVTQTVKVRFARACVRARCGSAFAPSCAHVLHGCACGECS
ncbi:hypothetical protein EON68_00030 [archaeon]|nr:MAG: hypothetical protein EON68_00030 [archaeon]